MSNAPRIAAVFMANGLSKRYGSNKLLTPFQGRPLIETVFDNLPAERFYRVFVVTRYAEVAVAAAERRFSIVENLSQADDTAVTIRLAMEALPAGIDGCMFLVCDQPYLREETIAQLTQTFYHAPTKIVAPSYDGQRGNPVIFPCSVFEELKTLPSGKSGSSVISKHKDLLQLVNIADSTELFDIDTPQDLKARE